MKDFSDKFDKDHKSIEMLTLADRVKNYNFNKRSVQDEIFAQYVTKYSTDGLMTLAQFVHFLDHHMIKKPGSDETNTMFNEIEEIL